MLEPLAHIGTVRVVAGDPADRDDRRRLSRHDDKIADLHGVHEAPELVRPIGDRPRGLAGMDDAQRVRDLSDRLERRQVLEEIPADRDQALAQGGLFDSAGRPTPDSPRPHVRHGFSVAILSD